MTYLQLSPELLTSQAATPGLLLVFAVGLLSFFSPCIVPVLPLYMGYLAGGSKTVDQEGNVHYEQKVVALHTLFFVLGISFAYIILAFAFSALGELLSQWQTVLVRTSAIIIIAFGIWLLFGNNSAGTEKRLKMPKFKSMNPLVAFILGFVFSFAWTPCIGPILASILIMVASAQSMLTGFTLLGVYLLGFVLPFLLLGFFTSKILNWISHNKKFLKYTTKAAAALLIIIGISMLTGWMNSFTQYLTSVTEPLGIEQQIVEETQDQTQKDAEPQQDKKQQPQKESKNAAPNFELQDQYGNTHTLSDYQGKVVFLNFWATWCPPCRGEMPDIEKLYQKYGANQDDVIILAVANPTAEDGPSQNDGSVEEVTQFVEENGYTFPVLMDTTGAVLNNYNVSAFPTTYIIDSSGEVAGYVPGAITYGVMEKIVNDTLQQKDTQR